MMPCFMLDAGPVPRPAAWPQINFGVSLESPDPQSGDLQPLCRLLPGCFDQGETQLGWSLGEFSEPTVLRVRDSLLTTWSTYDGGPSEANADKGYANIKLARTPLPGTVRA